MIQSPIPARIHANVNGHSPVRGNPNPRIPPDPLTTPSKPKFGDPPMVASYALMVGTKVFEGQFQVRLISYSNTLEIEHSGDGNQKGSALDIFPTLSVQGANEQITFFG
ncbi:unnamed protein product [Discosporangium mesarthrocarpum]